MTSTEPTNDPARALSLTIGSENLVDLAKTSVDAGADAAISALHGVPLLGIVVGIGRVAADVHKELHFRKVVRFLQALNQTSHAERQAFTDRLRTAGKLEEFGENILLLLDKLDDVSKPTMVGRVMAAHVRGDIAYEKAMRLVAIIGRCYASDLSFLKTFKPGTQGKDEPIADMLFSAGLLANNGIDGGTFAESKQKDGGTIYGLNEYAELLLAHAL